MAYTVPLSSIPLLLDPPFVFGLVWLGTAAGYRVLRLLHAPLDQTTPLERGILAAALGLGLLQFPVLALGKAKLLTPAAIWGLLALLLALLARDMVHVAAGAWRAIRRKPPKPLPRWVLLGILLLSVPLAVAFLQALCPVTDHDGLCYHLNAPKRWLQWGRIDYLPTLVQTNRPMGVEMLFTLALAVWSDTAAKLIHFALGILALLAIFALGNRVRGPAVGFVTAALWLRALPRLNALYLFSWAFVDLGITLEIVCAVLACLLWLRGGARGWLWTAALCAGLATSFKLTGAFVGVALALVAFWEERRRGVPARTAVELGAAVLGISLLPALPWFARTWQETGNPVYPLLSSLFPTRDWGADIGRAYSQYFRLYNWDVLDVHWPPEKRRAALLAAMALVAGGTTLLVWRWRDRDAQAITVVAGLLLFFGLSVTGFHSRLILPMFVLIYLLLAMAFARPLTRSRLIQAALLVYLAGGIWISLRKAYPRPEEAWRVAAGLVPRREYVLRELALAELFDYVNVRPNEGPVLVAALEPTMGIGGSMSFYSDRYAYTTDGLFQRRFRLDTWAEFTADVRREKIAWLVLPTTRIYNRDIPDYPPARNEVPFAYRLARDYGTCVLRAGDFRLYRLSWSNADRRRRGSS